MNKRPQILLSNDDGILSPGLWAAARELAKVGYVTVAAPREQHSGAGRSVPAWTNGEIKPTLLTIGDQEWTCYAVGGSPAQAVQYGIFAILKQKPDLVVSGINYGENPATDISLSGTVGAALEAASYGIPALAVSLQLTSEDFYGYSNEADFSTAAVFTRRFAQLLLTQKMPVDVQVLNVNVPLEATPQTPWRTTRLGRHPYFTPFLKEPTIPNGSQRIDVRRNPHPDDTNDPQTDVHVFYREKLVSVTPLSLDFTSRVDLAELQRSFGKLDE
jgi:5'-nucleotidase